MVQTKHLPVYPEIVESIVHIVCSVYEQEGLSEKTANISLVLDAASETSIIEFYGEIPTYLQTPQGWFGLPRYEGIHHPQNLKSKVLHALEQQYDVQLLKSEKCCIPPYVRSQYELKPNLLGFPSGNGVIFDE